MTDQQNDLAILTKEAMGMCLAYGTDQWTDELQIRALELADHPDAAIRMSLVDERMPRQVAKVLELDPDLKVRQLVHLHVHGVVLKDQTVTIELTETQLVMLSEAKHPGAIFNDEQEAWLALQSLAGRSLEDIAAQQQTNRKLLENAYGEIPEYYDAEILKTLAEKDASA